MALAQSYRIETRATLKGDEGGRPGSGFEIRSGRPEFPRVHGDRWGHRGSAPDAAVSGRE